MRKSKFSPLMREWYDSLNRREKAHYRIGIRLQRFEDRMLGLPEFISKYDFWYHYGEKTARPICWVLGHYSICTNYRNVWHCATCGKYPLPENPKRETEDVVV